jgi:hypothetical protein
MACSNRLAACAGLFVLCLVLTPTRSLAGRNGGEGASLVAESGVVSAEYDPKKTLIVLEKIRFRRARLSSGVFMGWGVVEATAGTTMVVTETRAYAGGVGFAAGVVHAISGYYQWDLARRRHLAFVDRLSFIKDRPPEALDAMVDTMRLSVEREARSHAFATGIYTSMVVGGAILFSWPGVSSDSRSMGVALVGGGAAGMVHHIGRWRFAIRLSLDLSLLDERAPTILPDSRLTPGPTGSVGRGSSTGNLCFESASVALRPRIIR